MRQPRHEFHEKPGLSHEPGRYHIGMRDERAILGLFAKWPTPGTVKTRLARDSSPEFACQVASAFLADSILQFEITGVRRILAVAPASEQEQFKALVGERWEVTPQIDGDLGTRLSHFFAEAFREGAERVVVIGTDSPTLPPEYLERAFQELTEHDVVIGPATDGGYYLIGLNQPSPNLFDGICWSTSNVLQQTVDRLGSMSLHLLPPWFDVDTIDDWAMFCGYVKAMHHAGLDHAATRSAALIRENEKFP